jgi:hypothetical protein
MERIIKQNRNHIQQTPLPNTEPRQLARASLLIDTNQLRAPLDCATYSIASTSSACVALGGRC